MRQSRHPEHFAGVLSALARGCLRPSLVLPGLMLSLGCDAKPRTADLTGASASAGAGDSASSAQAPAPRAQAAPTPRPSAPPNTIPSTATSAAPTLPSDHGLHAPWRLSEVRVQATDASAVTLSTARAGRHQGYDRLVLELDRAGPGYSLAYATAPPRACGSGQVVKVRGQAYLVLRLENASAHRQGKVTAAPPNIQGLSSIRDIVQSCDYEGDVTWVLGLAEKRHFRTTTLEKPARLVVDVAHPR